MKNIVIIGAGASGLMAAAESAKKGNRVTVVEKMPRPARKVLISGKGRCNVTNACFDTCSYYKFAAGYYLYRAGMIWFWNQYTMSERNRNQITASPLRADFHTMILNGEADVLRDEGEAFAVKLRKAGVNVTAVRFQGIIHDFVMLNALDQTKACRAAMDVSTAWINGKNE